MNKPTKDASNAESLLHQRLGLFTEADIPWSGETATGTPGPRAILNRLTSQIKGLWADEEEIIPPLPPGRELERMILIYAPGDEPVPEEAAPDKETHRRCSVA